jgi:hypothetical protein
LDIKRIIGPLLALLLALGVGYGIWQSGNKKAAIDAQTAAQAAVQDVNIVSGSESVPYLNDPRVAQVLLQNGIRLTVQKSGSREIAQRTDLKQFDAAFPGGVPAAEKIKAVTGATQSVATFFTPMVIASWRPLLPLLEANGLVSKRGENWFLIDMGKLMQLMEAGARWRDLKDNSAFAVGKSLLVLTTDVRKSNSAAQYLALTSWIANGGNVVTTDEEIEKIMPRLLPLFLKQGYQENTSSGPFENYMAMGMGAVPLVMVYESQFFEAALHDGALNQDMVLLYPEPTVYSKRIIVPFNAKGEKLAHLLSTQPELQKIAAEYGMRGSDPKLLADALAAKKLPAAPALNDVVEAPTFEMLEKMIVRIESQLNQ